MMIRERGLYQVIAQCAPKNCDELLCPDYTHASGNYILRFCKVAGYALHRLTEYKELLIRGIVDFWNYQ